LSCAIEIQKGFNFLDASCSLLAPLVFIATQLIFHEQMMYLLTLKPNDQFGGEEYPAQLQFLPGALSVGHEWFTLFIH
jgi:hypothetical protein